MEVTNVDVRDANNCQIECTRSPICNYWTFVTSQNKCYLKQELNKAKAKQDHQSGPKKCMKESEAKIEMTENACMQNGVDLFGSDIANFDSPDKETCQQSCQDNPKCRFFTLNGVSAYFIFHFCSIRKLFSFDFRNAI